MILSVVNKSVVVGEYSIIDIAVDIHFNAQ